MSGDPSAKEKLMINAVVRFDNRKEEYSKAFNWDSTPTPLACRSNVKYHVRERTPRGLGACGCVCRSEHSADMTTRIIVGDKLKNWGAKDLLRNRARAEAQFDSNLKAGSWRLEAQPARCPFLC